MSNCHSCEGLSPPAQAGTGIHFPSLRAQRGNLFCHSALACPSNLLAGDAESRNLFSEIPAMWMRRLLSQRGRMLSHRREVCLKFIPKSQTCGERNRTIVNPDYLLQIIRQGLH
jgi:hypothetical protein